MLGNSEVGNFADAVEMRIDENVVALEVLGKKGTAFLSGSPVQREKMGTTYSMQDVTAVEVSETGEDLPGEVADLALLKFAILAEDAAEGAWRNKRKVSTCVELRRN